MKDDTIALGFIILVGVAMAFTVIGISVGIKDEHERIYAKCLKSNEELKHYEAVALCKERT